MTEHESKPHHFEHGHALLVGVGRDLPTTINDAKDLCTTLTDDSLCAYKPQQVELLCGEDSTLPKVLAGLDRLAERTRGDSQATVIVFFSGHGLGGQPARLMTHDYDLQRLDETTISSQEFTDKLRAIDCQKMLVLLDCCHAIGATDVEHGILPKAPIPLEALEEFTRGSGRVVLASSRVDEYSYTHDGNSYFTEALLEALTGHGASRFDGYTRVLDIALYVARVVPNRKRDFQHPVLEVWDLSENFTLSYYAGSKGEDRAKALGKPPGPRISSTGEASRISLQVERVEDRRAALEAVKKRLREYRNKSERPRDLERKKLRLENEITELEGLLDRLPQQSPYRRTVSTLWTGLGVLILFTYYNLFAITQDWPALFWTAFQSLPDPTVSLFGLYWGVVTFPLLILLTHAYRYMDDRTNFFDRLPVAFNLPLFSDSPMRRALQAYSLIIFFLIPLYLQGHFFNHMLNGKVHDSQQPKEKLVVIDERSEHFFPPLPSPFSDRYRFDKVKVKVEGKDKEGNFEWKHGVSYYPIWTAWTLAILETLILLSVGHLFCTLARPPRGHGDYREGRQRAAGSSGELEIDE